MGDMVIDALTKKRERQRRYIRKLKLECFMAYGGCRCSEPGCTETDPDRLELHHNKGKGNQDRAERLGRGLRSEGGWNFYIKLRQTGFPPGFRVICTPHHDVKHGRYKKKRLDCSPGLDPTRVEEVIPF